MNLVKNERGQGIMEYIILTSLIGVFCLVAVKQFGQVIRQRVEYLKKEVVEHIELN